MIEPDTESKPSIWPSAKPPNPPPVDCKKSLLEIAWLTLIQEDKFIAI